MEGAGAGVAVGPLSGRHDIIRCSVQKLDLSQPMRTAFIVGIPAGRSQSSPQSLKLRVRIQRVVSTFFV